MEGSSSYQHKRLGFGTINLSDYQGLDQVSSFNNSDHVLNQDVLNLPLKENENVEGGPMVTNPHVLSQDVLNLPLKDSMNVGNENAEGGPVVIKVDGKQQKKPNNCTNFMRHSWCKFGSNCRYNHSFTRRSIQANKEIMIPREGNLNRMGQVECKNYLQPEGFINRYNHSGRKTVGAPVLEFNFLGLPIRPGEKECPHFRRNGSCKYGLNCWFDHPYPSSMGGGFPNTGYAFWEDTMPCWSLAGPVNEFGPSFDPYMYQPTEFAPYSEWNGYQVPLEHHEVPTHTVPSGWSQAMPAAFSMKAAAAAAKPFMKTQWTVPAKESPKADVQPERTCKFGFGFGFQHPKPPLCPLNDRGLPLRSDTEVCALYRGCGVCKLGPACKFDHPVTLPKSVTASGSEEAQVPAAGSVEAQVLQAEQ